MLRHVKDALHPAGWTGPTPYRIATATLLAAFYSLWRILPSPPALGFWIIQLLGFSGMAVLVLLTIRRLRDAGWSPWWTVLLLIHFRIGGLDWPILPPLILNFVSIYKLIPLGIGWFAASVPAEQRVI
jgi:uncharacterized membrane protein YhaH (DUF805 family)